MCPAQGGPAWSELTTDHFVVASDLRRADAALIARELESVRAWVIAALFEEAPDIPGRVRVVAFRSAAEFDEFAPPGLRAYFTRSGIAEPVIVMPGALGPELRLVLAHELTHQVARQVYPNQRGWRG